MANKIKKHWYKIFIRECPVCGSCDEWRERQYGKRPKYARFDYQQQYDHCEI